MDKIIPCIVNLAYLCIALWNLFLGNLNMAWFFLALLGISVIHADLQAKSISQQYTACSWFLNPNLGNKSAGNDAIDSQTHGK